MFKNGSHNINHDIGPVVRIIKLTITVLNEVQQVHVILGIFNLVRRFKIYIIEWKYHENQGRY